MSNRQKAAWVAICIGCVSGAEGLRQTAYRDVGGIPTLCYGETKNIHMGQTATKAECVEWLGDRVEEFGRGVDACTTVTMPPKRKAAMVDFAYNVGTGNYCKFIAPQINAGETAKACDHLLRFTKAAGIELPGLVSRRHKEFDFCMEGLT